MKTERDPGNSRELTRREFLRNAGILGASALTLTSGLGVVASKASGETADPQPEAPAPAKPPRELLIERSEAAEGIHHALHRNEFGFYEKKVFKRELIDVRSIVLHWTAADYDPMNSVGGVINGLKSNPACHPGECGYGLFIDRQGVVFQLVDQLNTRTNHAVGMNDEALGVSLEGVNEESLLNNPAQYESALYTVRTLQEIFQIQDSPELNTKMGILGHNETDRAYGDGYKSDPGQNFMARMRHDLAA